MFPQQLSELEFVQEQQGFEAKIVLSSGGNSQDYVENQISQHKMFNPQIPITSSIQRCGSVHHASFGGGTSFYEEQPCGPMVLSTG
ncbi:hypothetical protein DPEC_G00079490 [Dallia pectoralis]|uniref:Uncharacterized protein n=1 Tax=Dallia pectoralis TaxID=75939 RepID=A0ACC2H556_DALPE|nr:hypothetical protein DPEC_G00079490 [Dallia pectoralis]